ncbi:MAG: hypothetical protein HKL90_15565 [Elusimicrobia bacterium]|nr:hypothetical protein [Elusimicrobiota bacterium]
MRAENGDASVTFLVGIDAADEREKPFDSRRAGSAAVTENTSVKISVTTLASSSRSIPQRAIKGEYALR